LKTIGPFVAPGAGTDDSLGFGISSASSGYQGDGTGHLQLLVNMAPQAEIREIYNIDFGANASLAGVSVKGNIELDASLTAALTAGLTPGSSTPTLPSATLNFHAAASATLHASLTLGFLEASIDPGTASFSGDLSVSLNVSNFSNPGGSISGTPTSTFTTSLPITVTAAGLSPTTQSLLSVANLTLSFAPGSTIFGTSTHGAAIPLITAPSLAGANLLDFSNVSPSSVLSLLGNVFSSLDNISQNSLLQTQIPFTNKTLADALAFGQNFTDDVLSPLHMVSVATQTDGASPSTNEVQVITARNVTGGTFTLSFGGQTTAPITWTAGTGPTAQAVEDALGALSSIGKTGVVNNVHVDKADITDGQAVHRHLQRGQPRACQCGPDHRQYDDAHQRQGRAEPQPRVQKRANPCGCAQRCPRAEQPNHDSYTIPGAGQPGTLSFTIATPDAIKVATTTQGTAAIDEIETVTINDSANHPGQTFELGFKDANGVYHFTSDLADAISKGDLDTAIEGLDSSLAGKVTVDDPVGGVYTISFRQEPRRRARTARPSRAPIFLVASRSI